MRSHSLKLNDELIKKTMIIAFKKKRNFNIKHKGCHAKTVTKMNWSKEI